MALLFVLAILYVIAGTIWALLLSKACIVDGSLPSLRKRSTTRCALIIIAGFIACWLIWPWSVNSYRKAGLLWDVLE